MGVSIYDILILYNIMKYNKTDYMIINHIYLIIN